MLLNKKTNLGTWEDRRQEVNTETAGPAPKLSLQIPLMWPGTVSSNSSSYQMQPYLH